MFFLLHVPTPNYEVIKRVIKRYIDIIPNNNERASVSINMSDNKNKWMDTRSAFRVLRGMFVINCYRFMMNRKDKATFRRAFPLKAFRFCSQDS